MGNRVEDGNRAKNWVVQTFSIRGPVFIFAQRMSPSPSSFLSSALWFLAVSPSSRALFFFTSTVLDFLPFCNLEKIIFFPLDVAVSFYPGRKMAFDVFLFFFFFFSAKEGFVYLCKRKQQTGFLGWFVGWFRVIYLIVLMEVSSSLTSFRFVSLLLVPKNCNETNKKFIDFYFPPFLFPVSRSVMRYE